MKTAPVTLWEAVSLRGKDAGLMLDLQASSSCGGDGGGDPAPRSSSPSARTGLPLGLTSVSTWYDLWGWRGALGRVGWLGGGERSC